MTIFDIPKTHFISHRGFTPIAPENSLPSFYYAGLLGQWAIETDLHITRDGEIVCCHNVSIEKYCNVDVKIAELSYNELCQFEIVNGNRMECFTKEERRIPLFSEYLSICRQFGSVPFMELKVDDAEYVIHYLRKNGFMDNDVIMSSTDLSRLEESRRCAPDMFVHWIFAQEERLSDLCMLGNAGFSLKIADPFECDKEKISLAHQNGLKICLRAADDVKSLNQMKVLGIDYYPTNKMHDKI